MDRLVKERLRVRHYLRYMDDAVLLHPDRDFLLHCMDEIRAHVENELAITLNPKSQIFPLSQGVEFLGWRFYLTESGKVIRKLRASSAQRIEQGVAEKTEKFERGVWSAERLRTSLDAYRGHLAHGNARRVMAVLFASEAVIENHQPISS